MHTAKTTTKTGTLIITARVPTVFESLEAESSLIGVLDSVLVGVLDSVLVGVGNGLSVTVLVGVFDTERVRAGLLAGQFMVLK
jgi:hypothetical protein